MNAPTGYGGMFVPADQDPRPTDEVHGELATYRQYLTAYRMTLELKCDGLTPEQLATRSVPPSALSLLGLVRHLARVEQFWFRIALQGLGEERLYDDGDSGFADVRPTDAAVADAFGAWREQVALADAWLDGLAEDRLDDVVVFRDGAETSAVRDILVHMVEEYARHVGHADLLRECLDGRAGQ
ncbi:DinB family protein [Puerhibacterium puerhi]|uniref:DinB family protein n=1 Tax=Puerhibacterium puerhi TaxID=2692623 RepID=UPI001F1D0904|nr:DinB family protein [Puerhibacterium puerhi]